MQTVLVILDIIVSLMLVLVVLFQSGKEAGLSGALSGNTDTYMSKNKRAGLDKMLATSTKWIALAWVIITLALVLVVAAA
jgi:preprotein translocase subunit SecG